jgi:hypothetical protein
VDVTSEEDISATSKEDIDVASKKKASSINKDGYPNSRSDADVVKGDSDCVFVSKEDVGVTSKEATNVVESADVVKEDAGVTSNENAIIPNEGNNIISNEDDPVVSDCNDSKLDLELIAESEAFAEEGDDFVFDYTKLIFRKGRDYFSSRVDQQSPELKNLDLASLELTRIPTEHFCPKLKEGITQAPQSLPGNYTKRPSLLTWDPLDEDPESIGKLVLQEAQICEILKKHPHPNIVQYFGCTVEEGRVTGLCLANYVTTLSENLVDASPAQRNAYYQGLEKGVRHLHQLGLIHNDLNPSKIMMDGETPVIIDFDSCRPKGEKLGDKAGTFEWELEEAEFATPENDFRSLEKLKAFILKADGI